MESPRRGHCLWDNDQWILDLCQTFWLWWGQRRPLKDSIFCSVEVFVKGPRDEGGCQGVRGQVLAGVVDEVTSGLMCCD